MKIILIVFLFLSGIYLTVLTIMTIIYRPRKLKVVGQTNQKKDLSYPHVSILKPIKGVDDGLEANLESFYWLDYPSYEIIYALDDWKDKAVEIIRRVSCRYPLVRTQILATGHSLKSNPKIHKLDLMERQSQGHLLWVVDANIRVEPETLRLLVDEYLKNDPKLVFSPIMGTSSRSLASLMENTYLNFFTSGNVITLWKLFSWPIVVGKSILIDRIALRSFGGFNFFKDYLAEDYIIGQTFQAAGFKVRTNFTWVANISQRSSFKHFYQRMARWARLRYQLHRPAYLSEIFLNPIILSFFGLLIAGRSFWLLCLFVASVKILLEYVNFLGVNLQDRKQLINHLLFPLMVITKDLILFVVYLTPFFSLSVDWRGERLRIGKKSLICHSSNSYF
ncbi:MAG: glycosyltransferase [Candidatus Aminicenantes bacterium]|nr:glycosyltransferase [Candidatus Aminicenantes bacterium]